MTRKRSPGRSIDAIRSTARFMSPSAAAVLPLVSMKRVMSTGTASTETASIRCATSLS
jgi:hypothetical protein